MIRSVPDTNVLAAGVAKVNEASPAILVMERWIAESFVLVTSTHILNELRLTLKKKYFAKRVTLKRGADYLALLTAGGVLTPITRQVHRIAAHHQDDLVLATALSGDAAYVVTGDHAFLRVREHRGVHIVTPRRFLGVLDNSVDTLG